MKIVEVHDEMIGAVKQFLANRDGFHDANGWEGLFNYPWKLKGHPYGYAILDEDRIVAFAGTIFSERLIGGQKRICCNASTWFVEEEYRPRMLAILVLNPIVKRRDLLVTALTSSDISRDLLAKLGFHTLDHTQIAVPVIPPIPLGFSNGHRPLVTFDKDEIEPHLDEENLKILKDHATLQCEHFLIKETHTNQYCYGVATAAPIQKLSFLGGRWLSLCYVSDGGVFARNFRPLRRALWQRKFFLLRYDARLLPPNLARITMKKVKTRQYKWEQPTPPAIDNLYSELVTFNKY